MASRPPVPPRPPGLMPFPRPGAAPMAGAQRLTPPPLPPKPAGLVPAIQGGQIETIVEMGGGGQNPIWLVTMKGGTTKIVVKKEAQFKDENMNTFGAHGQKNIKAISSVMTVVSPTAAMDSLSPQEIMAISAFTGTPKSLSDAIPLYKSKTVNLVKMKYDASFASYSNKGAVPLFDGDQGAMSKDERDKAMAFFESIRGNRKVFQSLGKVFIADALVGNNDRADFGGSGQGVGISNFGNLIFSKAKDGSVTGALGLDAVDPTANLENMMFGTDISAWEKGFGQRIKEKSSFTVFADQIIKDINKRRLVPWGMKPFGMPETTALAEGMMIGWDKFANKIGSTVRMGKGIPSGLMARAKYLGWVK